MKFPKPEILFSALFLIGEGIWTYVSYEYGTPKIIETGSWLSEEIIDFTVIILLSFLIYFVVRIYRLRQEASSKQYHDLFEVSPTPMWIIDAATKKFLLVNEAMVQKYGYTREELSTMTTYDIRPPEEVKRLNEYLQKVQKGLQDTGVWIHTKKNGEQFYVQTRTNLFKYQGKDSIVVLADDITDIVEKEKEISRLSLVAKNTINGIIITGADRKIEWVNDAFTAMTGYTLDEVLGKVPTHVLHGAETNIDTEELIRKAIAADTSYSGEVLNYCKNGSKLWVQTTISPFTVDGNIKKHVAIFLDINERKRQESMIQQQNEKLKEIAFASSHLIRAPLSNILGLTQLLDENPSLIHEIAGHLKTSAEVLDDAIRQMIQQASDSKQHQN